MFDPAWHDRPDTRLTLQPGFVWGHEPGELDEFEALEQDEPDAVERAALEVLGVGARDEVPVEFSAKTEGLGRGAEGPAIAIYVAAATIVVGQVLAWLEAAERVARFWTWVRTRRRPPVLSLGAVVMLSAVDLHRRIPEMAGVDVLWAGDVGGLAELGDLGYTGEDIYGVIFTRQGQMWIYIVDDVGQVIHFGDGRQYPHSGLRFLPGSGEFVGDDAPAEPPNMLLSGDGPPQSDGSAQVG